jgi:AAA+ ATPase superfamily predicted ATPase
VLRREIPFGESLRSTKKTLYRIQDPALRFWFHVLSPHRTRWRTYSVEEQKKLIHDHASVIFEDWCRGLYTDAARYWEANAEFDFIREDKGRLIVSEVKFKRLTASERKQILARLEESWRQSHIGKRRGDAEFEVIDLSILGTQDFKRDS